MSTSKQNLSSDDKNLNKELLDSTPAKTVQDSFYKCIPYPLPYPWRPDPITIPSPWPDPINRTDPIRRVMKSGQITYVGTNRREWILGNEKNNIIYGGGGNDILNGAKGNDTLIGGNGEQILNGAIYDGAEAGEVGNGELDVLKGGQGKDIFVAADKYNGNYYCGEGIEDYMLVQDFSSKQDKLQLTGSKELYYTKEEYIAGSSRADIGIYEKSSGDLMCVLQDIGNSSPALRSAGGGKLDLDKIAVFV